MVFEQLLVSMINQLANLASTMLGKAVHTESATDYSPVHSNVPPYEGPAYKADCRRPSRSLSVDDRNASFPCYLYLDDLAQLRMSNLASSPAEPSTLRARRLQSRSLQTTRNHGGNYCDWSPHQSRDQAQCHAQQWNLSRDQSHDHPRQSCPTSYDPSSLHEALHSLQKPWRYLYGAICSAPWGPSKTWEFCLKGGMLRMRE